jgi:hypothetical protein
MQSKTISRKRYGRQVTIRVDDELYDQLADRAESIAQKTPGLSITVSDVIRSILIQQLEKQRLEDQQKVLMGEAVTPVQASN